MTIDERVNDVMAKLHNWIEQGAHKRFHWDEKRRQHIVGSDEETRRVIIKIIVEASRRDGIEAEREAIARLIEQAGLISLRDLAKCVRARSKGEKKRE